MAVVVGEGDVQEAAAIHRGDAPRRDDGRVRVQVGVRGVHERPQADGVCGVVEEGGDVHDHAVVVVIGVIGVIGFELVGAGLVKLGDAKPGARAHFLAAGGRDGRDHGPSLRGAEDAGATIIVRHGGDHQIAFLRPKGHGHGEGARVVRVVL